MVNQKILGLLVILFLILAACTVPETQLEATQDVETAVPPMETVVPPMETPVISEDQPSGGYLELLSSLQATGATVEETGQLDESFFNVVGHLVRVNGADIQLFEFADEQSRTQASDTISQAGFAIGTMQVEWIDQPHFWADGRLIVLYVGQDEAIVELLSGFLGEPINEPEMPEEAQPAAVLAAISRLSTDLATASEEIEVISFGQQEWPDGCLGFAETDEACTMALVTGWQVILQVGEQQYEVRTNENGSIVRWRLLDPR